MSNYNWDQKFRKLFERCAKRYGKGDRDYVGYYKRKDEAFLESIGCKPREFFDFVEDFCEWGEPSVECAILVAAVRRDFFRVVQRGAASGAVLKTEDLPAREAELGGHPWLPRIVAKARAKLRGELDPEIMYSCGGDRAFLEERDIHPADFLRAVWEAGEDDGKVLDYVRQSLQASERGE